MLEVLRGFKGRKIFNKSLNADIEIRTSSIRKYKSFFADGNKRLIVPYIPELLEKANFSKAEKSYIQQEERNVVGYWKSDLPINIDKQSFIVHLTVKKDNNGNYFWDAQIKGLQTDSDTNPRVEDLTSLTISQSDENVNSDGKLHPKAYVSRERALKLPTLIADPNYILQSTSKGHEDRFVVVTKSRGKKPSERLSIIVQPNINVAVVSGYDEIININIEKRRSSSV